MAAPTTHTPPRLALLLCDTPMPAVQREYGDYAQIFKDLLRNALPASKSGSGSNSPAEDDNAKLTIEVQQDSTTFSRIRSLSSGAGMGVPPEASDALNQGTSRDSISANSLGTGSNTPTNTSSILSALKSKDKQALNAAAKEAMRKWSVNWNGFKRGRIGTSVG